MMNTPILSYLIFRRTSRSSTPSTPHCHWCDWIQLERTLYTMPADSSTAGAVPLNLLLDIDGTLAITDRLYLLAFQDLMQPFGYTGVDEAWFEKHVAGKVDAEVFRALLPADSTAEILEATSRKKDALFVQKAASVGAAIVPGLGEVLQMARSYVENGRPEASSPSSTDTLRQRHSKRPASAKWWAWFGLVGHTRLVFSPRRAGAAGGASP